jgi:hypothetical protein
MGIQNFPTTLQPIIKQGFLERIPTGAKVAAWLSRLRRSGEDLGRHW